MTNNYATYDALDFAQDDSFIRWVKGRNGGDSQFWEDWRTAHPEKLEELEAARQLVLALQVQEKEPSQAQIDDLWNKIDQATQTQEQEPKKGRAVRLRRILAYAAAAVVGLLLGFYFLFPSAQRIQANGGQLTYFFPDSSSIILNEASSISFRNKKWDKQRTVRLKGEAFFSVKKGETFKVLTPKGEVRVLGTSFNVRDNDKTFEVSCLTGRVEVKYGQSVKVLSARQKTYLQADGRLSDPETIQREAAASWRTEEMDFKNAKWRRVFDEIERQFGVRVQSSSALDTAVVNTFFSTKSLDSALYNIKYQEPEIEVRTTGDTVFISK